ncbi:MAG: DUF4382 domain-containing protein [Terriglobales bacterium]
MPFCVAVMAAGLLLFSLACGGNNPAAMGSVTVSLSDPATCAGPTGPFSHVYLTVKDVQASTSGNANGGFTDLTPNLSKAPIQLDLLGQANNQCVLATLGAANELQPGNYQQIRLILEDNAAADLLPAPGNKCVPTGVVGPVANDCVVLSSNGVVDPIILSSEATTGIKIPSGQIAGGQLSVAAGQTKDLNIDFNACSSIVLEGNGDYRLKPVLHAGELALNSSSINGTVVDKATGQPLVGGLVMVALEQKDASGIDRVMMATDADSSGNFAFCPVPAGTFDIVAVGVNGANLAYAATLTQGVSNGTSIGNVQLIAESGASTAPGTITGSISTSTGSAATGADLTLSALQAAATGSGNVTFTVPLVLQMAATASLGTAPGATCASNTDCATYSLSVLAAPATTGTFAAGGTTYTAGSGAASYMVEADAVVPSSGGTADCSPSSLTTAAVTVTPGVSVAAGALAFTGCQ